MEIKIDNLTIQCSDGENYESIVKRVWPDRYRRVLGIRYGGRTLPLNARAIGGATVTTLDVASEEGMRIYERSLRFVFVLAVRQLYPDARVRIENSTASGLYARIMNLSLDNAAVKLIEGRMRELVKADLPFTKRVITRAEAIKHFEQAGYPDKVRLLKYRPFEHFQLYSCDDMLEYFYGEMAPSTGYVPVFGLEFYLPGVQLLLPDPENPSVHTPAKDQPKLYQTFAQSAQWANILGCENAADLNELVQTKRLREFIRVNEALQESAIFDIARRFIDSGAQLILVAGPSSSGKTTFTHRLSIALRVLGKRPMSLSLDDYYIDREKIPLGEDGKPDLERLDTLDTELFNANLVKLLQGEAVDAPRFDFVSGKRLETPHRIVLEQGQPVLVEGIHGLNPELTRLVPPNKKYMIYISALTMLNLDNHNRVRTTDMRLLRRMVRDHLFRGTPPEDTLEMWPSVRRGEHAYIFPYQEHADVMFNSSLVYEAAILKKYAYPMLMEIKEDSPYYTRARRLVKFLNYVQTADVEDEIPLNSILREFIGGCCFYRTED